MDPHDFYFVIRGLLDWCYLWMEILVEVNARLRAMIAQNEDVELEHK